jgi:hypothetical protein
MGDPLTVLPVGKRRWERADADGFAKAIAEVMRFGENLQHWQDVRDRVARASLRRLFDGYVPAGMAYEDLRSGGSGEYWI